MTYSLVSTQPIRNKPMKTPTIIIAALNTLPLVVYVFIVLPLIKMMGAGAPFDSVIGQFFFYGFIYAALAYPLVLLINHVSAFLNFRKRLFKVAFINETILSTYIVTILVYGTIAFSAT